MFITAWTDEIGLCALFGRCVNFSGFCSQTSEKLIRLQHLAMLAHCAAVFSSFTLIDFTVIFAFTDIIFTGLLISE